MKILLILFLINQASYVILHPLIQGPLHVASPDQQCKARNIALQNSPVVLILNQYLDYQQIIFQHDVATFTWIYNKQTVLEARYILLSLFVSHRDQLEPEVIQGCCNVPLTSLSCPNSIGLNTSQYVFHPVLSLYDVSTNFSHLVTLAELPDYKVISGPQDYDRLLPTPNKTTTVGHNPWNTTHPGSSPTIKTPPPLDEVLPDDYNTYEFEYPGYFYPELSSFPDDNELIPPPPTDPNVIFPTIATTFKPPYFPITPPIPPFYHGFKNVPEIVVGPDTGYISPHATSPPVVDPNKNRVFLGERPTSDIFDLYTEQSGGGDFSPEYYTDEESFFFPSYPEIPVLFGSPPIGSSGYSWITYKRHKEASLFEQICLFQLSKEVLGEFDSTISNSDSLLFQRDVFDVQGYIYSNYSVYHQSDVMNPVNCQSKMYMGTSVYNITSSNSDDTVTCLLLWLSIDPVTGQADVKCMSHNATYDTTSPAPPVQPRDQFPLTIVVIVTSFTSIIMLTLLIYCLIKIRQKVLKIIVETKEIPENLEYITNLKETSGDVTKYDVNRNDDTVENVVVFDDEEKRRNYRRINPRIDLNNAKPKSTIESDPCDRITEITQYQVTHGDVIMSQDSGIGSSPTFSDSDVTEVIGFDTKTTNPDVENSPIPIYSILMHRDSMENEKNVKRSTTGDNMESIAGITGGTTTNSNFKEHNFQNDKTLQKTGVYSKANTFSFV